MAHNILKVFFGIRLCLYLFFESRPEKALNLAQNGSFFYLRSILAATFVTIAFIEFKYMPEFYT